VPPDAVHQNDLEIIMARVIGTSRKRDLVGARTTDGAGNNHLDRLTDDDLLFGEQRDQDLIGCSMTDQGFGQTGNGTLDGGFDTDSAGQARAQRGSLGPSPSTSRSTKLVTAMLALGVVAGLLTAVAIDRRLTAIESAVGKHEHRLQRVETATGVLR
jgi:hypothetical protein